MVKPSERSAAAANGDGQGQRPAAPRRAPWWANILLVDDDEAFSYTAAKALRAAGYDVSIAPDHRLALEILDSPRPLDLLITDIVMPNRVNGFALARMARLRRLDLKILYMTAFEVPTEEAVGKILHKPLPLEVLTLEARLALAGKSSRTG
jgi:CheY-like chemotaxis protein